MTIDIEIKWTNNFFNLNFYIFGISFWNINLFVHCRSIFQNDDNMIFCDMENLFSNQKKIDKFCGK